jgi:Tetrahydrodipicolinate N-succinyltransferase
MSENQKLKESIENAGENIANLSPSDRDVTQVVDQVIKKLDGGELRIAEKVDNQWTVNQWLKKAVLISFRINENTIL